MAHLRLTGNSGCWAETPGAAVLDEPTVLDLRTEAELTSWNSGAQQGLLGRYGPSAATQLWRWYVLVGVVRFEYRDSAQTSDFTQVDAGGAILDSDPGRIQLRGVFDGSVPSWTVMWRAVGTPLDDDSGWTTIGSNTPSLTDVQENPNVALAMGASGGGRDDKLATGDFYRGIYKKGAGGTLVFDGEPSDHTTWAEDQGSFTEKANNATVTLQGDAELVGGFTAAQRQLLLGVG